MNSSIITTQSLYWLLLIVALSGSLVWFLYYKNLKKSDLGKAKAIFLSGIRFLILVFIGFLLLGPLFKTISFETQKPIIIFAQDNSASMVLSKDSTFLRDTFPNKVNDLINKLSDRFETKTLQFGDSIGDLTFSFTDKETRFESLFEKFNTTYFNQNIGALIIASDGLYNTGTNPMYDAQKNSFPIYTIPFGDTIPHTNLKILKTDYNKVVYKGTNFPVMVSVSANMLKGELVTIEIIDDDNIIASNKFTVGSDRFFKKVPFYLKADSAGVFEYKIETYIDKKSNDLKNTKSIYVEVEDRRRKVVLLQNGYHPDAAVLKRIIDNSPAFECEVKSPADFVFDKEEYALIILHQLPSNRYSLQKILPDIIKNEIPLLFIIGRETSLDALNNLNLYINIKHKSNLFDETAPKLNDDFNLFNLGIDQSFLEEMTPLFVPFGDYKSFPGNQVVAYQRIGQIETQKPLWAFAENGKQKLGFIMGEGIWKWRLHEYKKYRDHAITNELVIKTIQYLALKNRKTPFVLDYSKIVSENRDVVFNAKVFNASNELVKGATVNFSLFDEKGNKYPYVFIESVDDYILSIGMLDVGKFNFKASTQVGENNYLRTGTFIVKENLIEQSNLMADFNMLYKLSLNSNGKQFEKNSMDLIFNEIEKNTSIAAITYSHKVLKELINAKWLLLLFVLMLTTEWFLRKIWGVI